MSIKRIFVHRNKKKSIIYYWSKIFDVKSFNYLSEFPFPMKDSNKKIQSSKSSAYSSLIKLKIFKILFRGLTKLIFLLFDLKFVHDKPRKQIHWPEIVIVVNEPSLTKRKLLIKKTQIVFGTCTYKFHPSSAQFNFIWFLVQMGWGFFR
jgi:hypothetical protein